MSIVGRELIVPFAPPGFGIEREDGTTEQVIALSDVSVRVGAGISDGPVQRIQLGIIRSRKPGTRTAAFPTVALPSVASELPRRRNGVRPPQALAGVRVVSVDKTSDAVLAAGDAGNAFVLECQRGGGDTVTLHRVGDLRLPHERATSSIESNQSRVERSEIDQVSEDRDAAINPVAFIRVHYLLRTLIFPDLASGPGIQSVDFSG